MRAKSCFLAGNITNVAPQMDLYDFLNHESMGGGEADPRYPNRRGSSVWGWVGPKGRQIALIGNSGQEPNDHLVVAANIFQDNTPAQPSSKSTKRANSPT
jgi:hypothetical protein